MVVAALGCICLAIVAPQRSLRDGQVRRHLTLIRHLRVGLPMAGCIAHALLGGCRPGHHSLRLGWIVSRPSRVLEQIGLIHHIILNQVVCILRGHLIVTGLDGRVDTLVVVGSEALVVLQASIT